MNDQFHISNINSAWRNPKHPQFVGYKVYTMHTDNGLCINIQTRGHTSTFFKLTVCWLCDIRALCKIESLTTASDILTQLKQLTEGMVSTS